MSRKLLSALVIAISPALPAQSISTPVTAFADEEPAILMHGAVELAREGGGEKIGSLSALAWDEDEQILHAVSDEAHLYHFRPLFEQGRLVGVDFLERRRLRDEDGDKLKGDKRDSEGMHVVNGNNGKRGDTELLIAFEQKPRIDRFTPDGRQVGEVELPEVLNDVTHYSAPNHALEAVTLHPDYGVMTIPQRPQDDGHYLFAASGTKWPYAMAPGRDNEVVALETMPDGSLLFMERIYQSGFFGGAIVTFRRGVIDADRLELETLAVLDSRDGWRLDNFEGLARHEDGRYFIVSDNDDKASRRTLLYYFSFK